MVQTRHVFSACYAYALLYFISIYRLLDTRIGGTGSAHTDLKGLRTRYIFSLYHAYTLLYFIRIYYIYRVLRYRSHEYRLSIYTARANIFIASSLIYKEEE